MPELGKCVSGTKPKVGMSKLIEAGVRHRLLGELQEAMKVNEEGNVYWTGTDEVDQYISVLRDAFTFPEELSTREAGAIVGRGILDARKKGKLTDATVLESLQRITHEKLAQPYGQFSMWSRLSYRPPASARDTKFSYGGVSIRLTSKLPRYMQISDSDFARLEPIATKDKPGFCFGIAITSARNSVHAADRIFEACEIFQSVYNLVLKSWNITGSEQRPEATLLLGPYHFLFKGRKCLIDSERWYNQNYRDEFWKTTNRESDRIHSAAKYVGKALAKLEKHPLREPLSAALLMMNDGMETADMSRRTLRYWTALERLFQAGDERISYEKIIRRATYLDSPADIVRSKLARIVRIRNRYVHIGSRENEHHQLVQFLADLVSLHLLYLLFNGDDFADHNEFIEMTDLPSDAKALERRRRAIDRRERMTEKRRHRDD